VALRWLERAGRASCLVLPGLGAPGVVARLWVVPLVAALLGYFALWARYLLTGRRVASAVLAAGHVPTALLTARAVAGHG